MKITARRAKRAWILTRCLVVAIPVIHAIAHLIAGNWWGFCRWLSVVAIAVFLVTMERKAFHHGFHFGQIMILWCIRHDITPQEFSEMPLPEPWDLPYSTKTEED